MASPQTSIFALSTASHAYLEFDLLASTSAASAMALVAGLREPRTTIGGVNLVAGFRPELWATVAPDAAPIGVTGFNRSLVGAAGYTLPVALAGQAELAHEMVGWPYHHDLDLTISGGWPGCSTALLAATARRRTGSRASRVRSRARITSPSAERLAAFGADHRT